MLGYGAGPLARSHQRAVYDALLRAAPTSLLTLAADLQHLGARPDVLAVLHTWTQDLCYHPHVHVLITGGGLAPDGARWIAAPRPDFLFPGYALSRVFRGQMYDALRRSGLLAQVPPDTWTRDWVVHLQPAGTGDRVLDHLARYVFRIALTNRRLERVAHGQVTFRYRDRRTGLPAHCTLPVHTFLARFLPHVLPRGFAKVRHAGLGSPTCRAHLDTARTLLATTVPPRPAAECVTPPVVQDPVVPPRDRCPACHVGRLRVVATLPRARRPP